MQRQHSWSCGPAYLHDWLSPPYSFLKASTNGRLGVATSSRGHESHQRRGAPVHGPRRPLVMPIAAQSMCTTNGAFAMKVMTCRELGGPCDQELSAQTWDEMVKTMTKHVIDNHPDTAKAMTQM